MPTAATRTEEAEAFMESYKWRLVRSSSRFWWIVYIPLLIINIVLTRKTKEACQDAQAEVEAESPDYWNDDDEVDFKCSTANWNFIHIPLDFIALSGAYFLANKKKKERIAYQMNVWLMLLGYLITMVAWIALIINGEGDFIDFKLLGQGIIYVLLMGVYPWDGGERNSTYTLRRHSDIVWYVDYTHKSSGSYRVGDYVHYWSTATSAPGWAILRYTGGQDEPFMLDIGGKVDDSIASIEEGNAASTIPVAESTASLEGTQVQPQQQEQAQKPPIPVAEDRDNSCPTTPVKKQEKESPSSETDSEDLESDREMEA